jgi:hypothetical protein
MKKDGGYGHQAGFLAFQKRSETKGNGDRVHQVKYLVININALTI